ncbi:hypothetical protein KGQ20_10240 [Catenulispora sp. NF23]|uniref:Uncharacterized protein n=1 Tax=Catenulispora pinistramenti TaxID=2705254 RepID=A0ABS5KHR1_9ACTN|nr:hypothetical protein [Catenulispora pinistramenti]MBS2533154.1 hypothetical protein [Catenulispora pinistramenti]MBS2545804.1 hypothetical protein [Catenulispora pinistramenti]
MNVDEAGVDELFTLAGALGWGCRDRGSAPGSMVRRRIDVELPVGGSVFGVAGRGAREVNNRLEGRPMGYEISRSEVLRSRQPLKPGIPAYRVQQANDVPRLEKIRQMLGAGDLVFAAETPMNGAEQSQGAEALAMQRRRDRWITTVVGAVLFVVGVIAMIVLLARAPRSSGFEKALVLTVIVAGSLPGIRRFLRGGQRAKVLLVATPLAFPLILPATIAMGNARVSSYLDHFGLSRDDLGVGSGLSYSAAALPVAVAVALSLMVIGLFGWIAYLVGDDRSIMAGLMVGISIVAYLSASIDAAIRLGDHEGAAAVAAVRAGRAIPGLEDYRPDFACVTPLKTPISIRGAMLATDHPIYVFSSPHAALVVTWDPRTGQPTWVAPADVSVLIVGTTVLTCPVR